MYKVTLQYYSRIVFLTEPHYFPLTIASYHNLKFQNKLVLTFHSHRNSCYCRCYSDKSLFIQSVNQKTLSIFNCRLVTSFCILYTIIFISKKIKLFEYNKMTHVIPDKAKPVNELEYPLSNFTSKILMLFYTFTFFFCTQNFFFVTFHLTLVSLC